MIRFMLRLLGLLAISGGFVMLVIDGIRSIANSTLDMTPLLDLAARAFPKSYPLWGPAIERNLHPLLWDPLLLTLLMMPAFIAFLGVGLFLLRLGRRRPDLIGFDTKS
jgi:hypothetical protein